MNPNAHQTLVSVIIPFFNAENSLLGAVNSILNQSFQHVEVILIDDGSEDQSSRIAERLEDPRIRLVKLEQNHGYLKAVNIGLGLAKGDFITFQDADDLSLPLRLEKQLIAFEQNPDIAAVGTQCIFQEKNKQSTSSYPASYDNILRFVDRGENAFFCGATLMVRRNVVEKVGAYSEIFDRIGAEDLDWVLRIISNHTMVNLADALYIYDQTQDSVSRGMSLDPAKYFSAQLAMLLYKNQVVSESKRKVYAEKYFEELRERMRNSPGEMYRIAGLAQVVNGNFSNARRCYREIVKESGYIAALVFMIYALPFALLSTLRCGTRKKVMRLAKFLMFRARFIRGGW